MIFLILITISFLLSFESIWWCFAIHQHSVWILNNPEYDRRQAISPKTMIWGMSFIGISSLLAWFWFWHNISMFDECLIHEHDIMGDFIISCLYQFTIIYMCASIARYSCLHTEYWPIISKLISSQLIKYFNFTDLNKYCLSLEKWNKLDLLAKKHNILIIKFADEMADIIWTKDQKLRFTYVNPSMAKLLLKTAKEEVIGFRHMDIAEKIREKGITYSFDLVCEISDKELFKNEEIIRYISSGIIDGEKYHFHILKSPIMINDEIKGLIGVGRNITFEVSNLEQIDLLFKAGKTQEGIELFYTFKENFMNLKHYKEEKEND